jgi:membrane-associated phospholipid phosphatase
LTQADAFRTQPPPDLSSAEYAEALNEVARLGGDGLTTPTERTSDQTLTGLFWAYDGTPSLCAPPRLYNQVARAVGETAGLTGVVEWSRYLALVNLAMADAGIVAWESKYFYDLWRPVAALREADVGTGPTGEGDGNSLTTSIPDFTPLGAPASNLAARDFTPPFPAYPSGHAAFGGALFQVLRRWFDTDDIAFEFVSDEYNGVTAGSDGVVRPRVVKQYANLSEPEEENGQSRIYLGIHFVFDKTAGIEQGNAVGDAVFDSVFQPRQDLGPG